MGGKKAWWKTPPPFFFLQASFLLPFWRRLRWGKRESAPSRPRRAKYPPAATRATLREGQGRFRRKGERGREADGCGFRLVRVIEKDEAGDKMAEALNVLPAQPRPILPLSHQCRFSRNWKTGLLRTTQANTHLVGSGSVRSFRIRASRGRKGVQGGGWRQITLTPSPRLCNLSKARCGSLGV